ncbi:DUF3336 domain-containing protein [Sinimarinibacterium sp. CAU 1509]|uniref:DUF3336 domain-containing protein n=1 Tax=Sinimarinibacterium sp. CAU 1509 TaxID=2562283 RepID=UPI00200AF16A|nr:DUF3336 domain-containing protein [Sinimarinibacterium sp. CAU 1509]
MDRKKRELLKDMRNALDYASWREAAEIVDRMDGRDDWRSEDASSDYDWRLIRARLRQVRQYRQEDAVPKLVHHLRQGLHWNLGNTGSAALYGHAYVGTKRLIHEYIAEIADVLDWLCDTDHPAFPRPAKMQFFHDLAQSYGRSALMLSGGATLGLFHVGVVKALYREGLVPSIMSGSSAGSVVGATIGSRAPSEVEKLLDPEAAYYHFWRILPWRDMLRNRAMMDQNQLRKAIAANVGDLTFEEAHKLSGRVVNITVSPAGVNQPPRLLNYLTFPYLYLHEAILASCAVPVLFPPVMLMTQDENQQRVPYMPLLRWNDGSLKSDLPILRMRRLHNVNHFIVSQTNPHVLPFVTHHEPGEGGVLDTVRNYAFSSVRTQAKSLVDLVRQNLPAGGLARTLDIAGSVLEQEYRGNINIIPEVSLWRYANVTSNPSMDAIKRFMLEGERATWPRIEMIRNQTLISQTLNDCVERLERSPGLPRVGGGQSAASKPALQVVRPRPA